jgi:putative two-component system response regulator
LSVNTSTTKDKRTILIIDDELKILLGLRVLLERNGYKVIMCEDGPCGIKAAEEFHPDLIICDIMLPFMNGFKVRESISVNPATKDIPFIFLTARASKADKLSGFVAGADDYITKPFDPQELAARIQAIFRRQDDIKREMSQKLELAQSAISLKLQTSIAQEILSHHDNDDETEEQASRVIELSTRLAHELGMKGRSIEHIRTGAQFHDIGMSGVPDSIHLKQDPLTPEEREVMMTHVTQGKEILRPLGLPSTVIELVYYHHERWDGSGYPKGLAGKNIPLPARLFAVVNAWNALTSDRPQRKAWTNDKAIAYIKEQAGKHFDPDIVDKFLIVIQR